MSLRILLSGGGTAGHIHPALAIAAIIRRNRPGAEIGFVGTPDGMERRLVQEAGYPYFPIDVRGLRRSLSPSNLAALFLAWSSPRRAQALLRQWAPDAVIGTGGYVCWPLLRAACRAGIPCALHESNAVPGMTVRHLCRRVNSLWLGFSEAEAQLPRGHAPACWTGNPLREGFYTLSRAEARRKLGLLEEETLVLSFGGSLGAGPINTAVRRTAGRVLATMPTVTWVHATGRAHAEAALPTFQALGERMHALAYIDDMPLYMQASDVIISRAGAMTLSELAAQGKCAILIPSPHVAGQHQYKNALALAQAGAALLCEESALPGGGLTDALQRLLYDPVERHGMEMAIRRFAVSDAEKRIWQQFRKLLE